MHRQAVLSIVMTKQEWDGTWEGSSLILHHTGTPLLSAAIAVVMPLTMASTCDVQSVAATRHNPSRERVKQQLETNTSAHNKQG